MGDENNITHSGDILGTIRYIAPEVFEGAASPASDVYSLGITLYELATLRPAFEGDNKQTLIRDVTSTVPTPIRRCRADVPADLATIVHKAIERDPADRYRTAGDLAEDLRRLLNDEPIRARRTSLLQHFRRWARRNRALAASLLSIVLLMGFIAVASVGVAIHFRETGEQIAKSQETTTRNLYYASMRNAHNSLNRHRGLKKAAEILEEWNPSNGEVDLRDWEWFYLKSLCHQEDISIPTGHSATYALAIHPNRRWLASGGTGGIVRIWDQDTQACVLELPQAFDPINCIDWHPDGRSIAVSGQDGVAIWNVENRELIRHILEGQLVLGVRYSPVGKALAASTAMDDQNDAAHFLISAVTGETIVRRILPGGDQRHYTLGLDWSPGGKLAAFPDRSSINVWDGDSGQVVEELPYTGWCPHAVAFHPTNPDLLAAGGRDGIVTIYNRQTGQQSKLTGHTHGVSALRWNPDGQRLASASWDGTIRVWDTDSGQSLARLLGHLKHVFSLHWTPNGRQLVSSGDDGSIKLWPPDMGQFTQHEVSQSRILSMEFRADGSLLCLSDREGEVFVLDAQSFDVQTRWKQNQEVRVAGFHPFKPLVAAVDGAGGVELHNIETETLVKSSTARHPGPLLMVDWSPTGRELAMSGTSGVIEFRDETLAESRPPIEADGPISALQWSPVSETLAYTVGHVLTICDVDRKTTRAIELPASANAIAWSFSGTRLAIALSEEPILRIVAAAGDVPDVILPGHHERVPGIAWAPHDRRLVSVDVRGTVKIWDTSTGQETLSTQEQLGRFNCAAWSPDGRRVVVDCNGELLIWDASRGYDMSAQAH